MKQQQLDSFRFALLFLPLVLSGFARCERILLPPRPSGVPEGSSLDRHHHLWIHMAGNEERAWYETGRPASEGSLVQGARDGTWRWFAPDGITVTTEGVYRKGRREGLWIHRDDAGIIYATLRYAAEPFDPVLSAVSAETGNENGPIERFYPDGQLELRGAYRAGRFHGRFTRFFRDGSIEYEGEYREGLKEGTWRIHRIHGPLLREERYSAGQLDGPFSLFDESGRLFYEATFEHGVKKRERFLR